MTSLSSLNLARLEPAQGLAKPAQSECGVSLGSVATGSEEARHKKGRDYVPSWSQVTGKGEESSCSTATPRPAGLLCGLQGLMWAGVESQWRPGLVSLLYSYRSVENYFGVAGRKIPREKLKWLGGEQVSAACRDVSQLLPLH